MYHYIKTQAALPIPSQNQEKTSYSELNRKEKQKLAKEFISERIGYIPELWDERYDELYGDDISINIGSMSGEQKDEFSNILEAIVSRIRRSL